MKLRAIVVMAVVVMAFGAAPALAGPDGSVDLFAVVGGVPDPGACQGTTLFFPGAFAQIQISMQARLGGATASGISGVEGYLETNVPLPGAWAGSIAATAGSFTVGNWFQPTDPDGDGVFDTKRGSLVFENVTGPLPEDNCQVGDGILVPLGTITYADPFSPMVNIPNDTYLTVLPADPPSVPACTGQVIATLCNAPVFTAVCITGGQFIINPLSASCAVAVEKQTWSGIKGLYR